jgi:hypothetical protein
VYILKSGGRIAVMLSLPLALENAKLSIKTISLSPFGKGGRGDW